MNEEVFNKVKEMIAEQFEVDESVIKEDSTFTDDLAGDSLDLVELVMGIEERFGVQIPDEDAEKIVTVGDIVRYISENL